MPWTSLSDVTLPPSEDTSAHLISVLTMENTAPRTLQHWLVTAIVLVCLLIAGYLYIEHRKKYPSTDDAYVHGNIIYIAPRLGGQVKTVNVVNFGHVHEGEMLVQIDPATYEAQFNQARAAYAVASEENKAASEGILAASTAITTAAANLHKVQLNFRRTMTMVSQGVLPRQEGDTAQAALATARDNLAGARAHMAQLIAEQGSAGQSAPAVQEAAAALMLATLNLSYTNISAPADGEVGQVSVHPGSVVNAGEALMPLVVAQSFWVEANFKEDDLGRIQPGMPASVQLDMYPDTLFSGTVVAISPASGSSFSLLPPENATGNWVKITQRFPVRIQLQDTDKLPARAPLRVGASATVTVDTVASVHE